jgi:hypothetical protein
LKFNPGDKVRQGPDGPVMEILAASERLAICGWEIEGVTHKDVFETPTLTRISIQQQQQPQGNT